MSSVKASQNFFKSRKKWAQFWILRGLFDNSVEAIAEITAEFIVMEIFKETIC